MMRGASSGRLAAVFLIFLVLAASGVLVSLMMGSVAIAPQEAVAILMGADGSTHAQILWNIRLPRTLVAALVGIDLALSGVILQAIMKNPLADPHIIGIFPEHSALITPAAFVGAMGAAVLIYLLAWKNGIQPIRIILAGVAVSAFLGAGISALMILYSDRVHNALMWMVGGLSARSWPHVAMLWPYTLVGFALAVLAARHLNVLQLGDAMAKSLGMRVELTRLLLTAVAAILAASAVSVVGLLGFVGLIVPHMARLVVGSDHRILLPASALLGAAVLLYSDTFARVAFAPVELPVGIIMAALGAPFFLFLLRRQL